jgi:hypothetical protein
LYAHHLVREVTVEAEREEVEVHDGVVGVGVGVLLLVRLTREGDETTQVWFQFLCWRRLYQASRDSTRGSRAKQKPGCAGDMDISSYRKAHADDVPFSLGPWTRRHRFTATDEV